MLMQRSTSKLSAMMQLSLSGYDIPATRFSLNKDLLTPDTNKFPMILKGVAASRGAQNYLISNAAELVERLHTPTQTNRFLLQEYISNQSDLRIVCFGGQPQMAIRRSRQGDSTHLNNTSLGAEANLVELSSLSDSILEACAKVCKIMGRDMAGIDLIEANDGSSRQVFLEVNAIPQLTSGTYVDKKLELLSGYISKFLEN
jgi:glutathione synthase/RimK-type ligase-like ATP-grasp enzyme